MDIDSNLQPPSSTNTDQPRKPWAAPVLTSVSIADLTESSLNAGNDGSGVSTLS